MRSAPRYLAAIALLFIAPSARAYTYSSAISKGCHERITTAALRDVRSAFPSAGPITPSRDERALIGDLPFSLDADVSELVGASLMVGVRDNDLKGRGPKEIDQLAQIHGDPALQQEHCLRAPSDDGPDGSRIALDRCREFIRGRVRAALDGLDAQGRPDPAKRVGLDVTLDLRGRVNAKLPVFWIEIGRALHALQDSFTHTFRSPDRTQVRVVANYLEDVEGTLSEPRDGPAHRGELDACEDLDLLRNTNLAVATEASTAVLRATLDPALGREEKLARVEATLDAFLGYEPNCTFENGWCDAPERKYAIAAGCSVGRWAADSWLPLVALGMLAVVFAARRRPRVLALGVGSLLALAPSPASAQSAPDAATPAPVPVPPPDVLATETQPAIVTKQEATAEKRQAEHRSLFALYGAVSGSVSNESLNGQLGGRFRLGERWMVGLDGELNNWFGTNSGRLRTGAFNAYGTLVFRTPLRFADFNLRSTANAGVSTLLIDLYGAPRGTTGIFLGLTPLGLEWKVSSSVFIVLDAIGIALPIPQLSGAPFAYPQYRASLGLELAL